MDKQTVLGFILIALVLMVWMWWSSPRPSQQAVSGKQVEEIKKDSSIAAKPEPEKTRTELTAEIQELSPKDSLGKYFSPAAVGTERFLTVETDLYTAVISTKGAVIRNFELKNYKTWDQHTVQLVENASGGDFSLLFTSTEGKLINTKGLYFDAPLPSSGTVRLSGNGEYSLDFILTAGPGRVVKTLRFKNGSYGLDVGVKFIGMQEIIANYEYQVIWENGVRYVEHNSVDESRQAEAFSYAGGEVATVDAAKPGENPISNTNGSTEWVATRNKYFAVGTHLRRQEGGRRVS